jgi:UDP-N-acetyl-D-mannosaminuronic acid transferase (WecB/TagA/CpsF family)
MSHSVDQENGPSTVPVVQIGQAVTFNQQVFVTTFERVHREIASVTCGGTFDIISSELVRGANLRPAE